jgi:hypothetical protein
VRHRAGPLRDAPGEPLTSTCPLTTGHAAGVPRRTPADGRTRAPRRSTWRRVPGRRAASPAGGLRHRQRAASPAGGPRHRRAGGVTGRPAAPPPDRLRHRQAGRVTGRRAASPAGGPRHRQAGRVTGRPAAKPPGGRRHRRAGCVTARPAASPPAGPRHVARGDATRARPIADRDSAVDAALPPGIGVRELAAGMRPRRSRQAARSGTSNPVQRGTPGSEPRPRPGRSDAEHETSTLPSREGCPGSTPAKPQATARAGNSTQAGARAAPSSHR